LLIFTTEMGANGDQSPIWVVH